MLGGGGGYLELGPDIKAELRFRQQIEQLLCFFLPDARQQSEHPETGNGIAGIFRQSKVGNQIFDVCGFNEFQAAVFMIGDIAPGQFHFQCQAVMRCPEQHCLLIQGDTRFPMLENLPPRQNQPARYCHCSPQ